MIKSRDINYLTQRGRVQEVDSLQANAPPRRLLHAPTASKPNLGITNWNAPKRPVFMPMVYWGSAFREALPVLWFLAFTFTKYAALAYLVLSMFVDTSASNAG